MVTSSCVKRRENKFRESNKIFRKTFSPYSVAIFEVKNFQSNRIFLQFLKVIRSQRTIFLNLSSVRRATKFIGEFTEESKVKRFTAILVEQLFLVFVTDGNGTFVYILDNIPLAWRNVNIKQI